MKLFVDDQRGIPDGWEGARTVTEAIRKLDTMFFTYVSLDHDIQHGFDIKTGEETFEPVARFIAAIFSKRPEMKVIIHSGNPQGSEKMRRIFKDAGITSVYKPKI